jgi:hypothetical protein
MLYGTIAKKYGATQDTTGRGVGTVKGKFASFPTLAAGTEAHRELLLSKNYRNLTLDQALNRWTTGNKDSEIDKNAGPGGKSNRNYKSGIYAAINAVPTPTVDLASASSPTPPSTTTPNEQRPSKPYPTPTMHTMASAIGKDSTGHSYAPGGGGEPPEKPKGVMSSLLESLSGGIANINEASGGKLGFFSNELQAILRDKSFLEAIDTPMFADMSKNINSSDTTAYEGKTPSVYDEMLLSKLTRA